MRWPCGSHLRQVDWCLRSSHEGPRGSGSSFQQESVHQAEPDDGEAVQQRLSVSSSAKLARYLPTLKTPTWSDPSNAYHSSSATLPNRLLQLSSVRPPEDGVERLRFVPPRPAKPLCFGLQQLILFAVTHTNPWRRTL